MIEGKVFDLKKLKDWRSMIRLPPGPNFIVYANKSPHMFRMGAHLQDFLKVSVVVARLAVQVLAGQKPVTLGKSLIGQLLYMNKQQGMEMWRGSKLVELVTDEKEAVVGVVVERDGHRYLNEALDYDDFGKIMNKRHEATLAAPSWIIIDARHRDKYILGQFGPRYIPQWAIENGLIYKDDSIAGLAK